MTVSIKDAIRYFLECTLFSVAFFGVVFLLLPVDLNSLTLALAFGLEFVFLMFWKEYQGYELSTGA